MTQKRAMLLFSIINYLSKYSIEKPLLENVCLAKLSEQMTCCSNSAN